MLILTINYVPGKEIEALGIVKGNVVQARHIGKDIMAGLKNVVGGELRGYTDMGADAIIMMEYATSAIMDATAEVIAYGTAVKYKE